MNNLITLAASTGEALLKHGIDSVLAGGLAANVYRAEKRLTEDIDLVIATDTSSIGRILTILRKHGYQPPATKYKYRLGKFEWRRMVHPQDTGDVLLDMFFVDSAFLTSVLKRAVHTKVDDQTITYASVEDVVLFKLMAVDAPDRYDKDVDDIRSILANVRDGNVRFNVNYLVSWAAKLGTLRHAEKFLREYELL